MEARHITCRDSHPSPPPHTHIHSCIQTGGVWIPCAALSPGDAQLSCQLGSNGCWPTGPLVAVVIESSIVLFCWKRVCCRGPELMGPSTCLPDTTNSLTLLLIQVQVQTLG